MSDGRRAGLAGAADDATVAAMPTIALEGPGKNALSTELLTRMLEAILAAKDEPLFLIGAGDTFSAGLNLKEVATHDVAGMTRYLGTLEKVVKALYEHPAPVVAFVNGHAIAGGCVMALTADVRIATAREGVRIGLNEVALGLRFPPLTLAMCRARVSRPAIERAILEAALYDAKSALSLGLVDRIGEESDARAAFEMLSKHPRAIFASTKRFLRGTLDVSAEEQRIFREETIPYWASEEQQAKVRAYLERKKA